MDPHGTLSGWPRYKDKKAAEEQVQERLKEAQSTAPQGTRELNLANKLVQTESEHLKPVGGIRHSHCW